MWRALVDGLMARSQVAGRVVVAIACVAGLSIGAVAAVSARRASAPGQAPPVITPAPPEAAGAGLSTSTSSTTLIVDVAGAVARPGLVRLAAGSRVADAIAAVGGPTPDADLRQVNQARALDDGEQVLVPKRGEVVPTSAPASGAASKPTGPLDLNKATAAEFDALPGVGPSTAAAIVEWRVKNGRYRSVDDLLEVPGIGPAKLAHLRPLVKV